MVEKTYVLPGQLRARLLNRLSDTDEYGRDGLSVQWDGSRGAYFVDGAMVQFSEDRVTISADTPEEVVRAKEGLELVGELTLGEKDD